MHVALEGIHISERNVHAFRIYDAEISKLYSSTDMNATLREQLPCELQCNVRITAV